MNRKSFGFLFLMILLCVQSISAATVNGNAFKDGQTDHSGITVDLEPSSVTPTLGGMGMLLLLAGMTLFMFRKRSRAVMIPMVTCLIAGLSCITYAAMRVSTVTNSLGEYDFADVEPGGYSIDASAPGYYPEHIASFTVIDGANTAPDITLLAMEAGDLISIDPIVGNMRYIPGGTITQGSPEDEPCRIPNETQFDHTLTRNLAVMETEITRQMWADLLGEQPSLPADPSHTGVSSTMLHPVQHNTWYESMLFANLLSLANGYTRCYYTDAGFNTPVAATNYTSGPLFCAFDADGYRLATEGEWEYFCRGGTTTSFSCNEPNYTSGTCGWPYCVSGEFPVLEQYAVYCANAPGSTEQAGSKEFNPWNLKDVHGNVWEWCWDWYGTYPAGPETDYEGAGSGSNRVVRGGGWNVYPEYCRSALRNYQPPGYRDSYDLGFRLVRSID